MVWFVHGNFDSQEAISLVEQTSALLDLKPISVDEVTKSGCIKLEPGKSVLCQIALDDEKNDNSCIHAYYQLEGLLGNKDEHLKRSLTHDVVAQWLDQPYFDDLRTAQQLGYVVYCRARECRDCLGFVFLVQSNVKSAEYCVQAMNKHLLEKREAIKKISDEDFEQAVSAVNTIISEKPMNLGQDNDKMMSEISTHHYIFDRQDKSIEMLKTITKEEFLAHFEELFFSSKTARFDFELTSEQHKDQQKEYQELNANDEVYKHLERVKYDGTLEDLHQSSKYYADSYT